MTSFMIRVKEMFKEVHLGIIHHTYHTRIILTPFREYPDH